MTEEFRMNQAEIDRAVEHFRSLLKQQILRAERLSESETDRGNTFPKTVIGLIGGDGIGPIIVQEAKRVLEFLLKEELKSGSVELKEIDGLTIENRIAAGKAIPDDVLEAIKSCDVLLKGPTTTPSGGTMESANVTLRRELDLFANVRPVSVSSLGIDWTFFRENTEGEYTLGSKGIAIGDALTMDFKVTTEAGTRRIARAAFDFARKNGKNHVAVVTKSNIMKKTDGMFSRICWEVASEYPEIETDEYYIDIMTANLINPEMRNRFQVFLLPNLYGDILTDEAAQLQGGVGTAGSANLGTRYAMFEAIHGSAPRLIEQGLGSYASPQSILQATVMLLSHIGMPNKAQRLSEGLKAAAALCPIDGTAAHATCAEFGDALLKCLLDR